MPNIADSINKIRFLDELAEKRTWIHDIHPVCKLFVTIAYLFVVVSFGKYDTGRLLPFVFYPVVIFTIGELPVLPILKMMLVAAPFVLGIGIFNPLLDKSVVAVFFGVPISGGWISFFSLMLKCGLTVVAALLLLATTGMERIALALRMIRVPKIFVLQLLLTYRYITVLIEEANRIWNAYMLRAPGQKGVSFKAWGSLAGQMLMRSFDRAQRVYQAMGLRGFNGEYNPGCIRKPTVKDFIYFTCWLVFFAVSRYYNLPGLIGTVVTGVMK